MKKHFFIKSLIKLLGLLIGLLGFGLFLLAIFWKEPQNHYTSVSAELQKKFQVTTTIDDDSTQIQPTDQFPPTSTPTIQDDPNHTPSPIIQDDPIYTPTPVWMIYDGIDFRDKEVEVLLNMQCNQDTVYMKTFRVVPYSLEVLESGDFFEKWDFSIAWEHLGFYGLLIHSGSAYGIGELTAYPLQTYLEKDARGILRNPNGVDQLLQDCVINAEMYLRQENTISVSKVVAAVRVPPAEIDEVSQHPMDLVPYLAETYPDSGFDQMNPPGLVFYFCGQQLSGEMANPNYKKWTQARFVIGFMPVSAD